MKQTLLKFILLFSITEINEEIACNEKVVAMKTLPYINCYEEDEILDAEYWLNYLYSLKSCIKSLALGVNQANVAELQRLINMEFDMGKGILNNDNLINIHRYFEDKL